MHLAHAPTSQPTQEGVAADAQVRFRSGHALAACLALLAVASPLSAQTPSILVVRASGEAAGRAAELEARLLDGELEDGRRFISAPPPAPDVRSEDWLAAALAEAEDDFARIDLEETQAVLEGALQRLDREGTAPGSSSSLIELFLLGARVAQALGDEAQAQERALSALRIEPSLSVDLERHPPAVAELVEHMRPSLSFCPFTLEATPVDWVLGIDGRAPAPAPAPEELPCGVHWLAVTASGYHPQFIRIDLGPEAIVTARLALDAGAALIPSEPFSAIDALAPLAAHQLGGELVLLDMVRDGDGWRVQLGERQLHAPLEATAGEILSLLRAAGHVLDDVPVGEEAGEVDVGLVVGVSVGVAVALAAALTTLGVVLGTPAPTSFDLNGRVLP